MKSLLARFGLLCGVSLVLASGACGSRSELPPGASSAGSAGTGGMPPMGCSADVECGESDACVARRCVDGVCTSEATHCDDGDVCTEDTCDALAGCTHRALTVDADGDGFKGPRPGFAPGTRDACGDDCDDRSALAFPGNREVCDGVDNDCNAVVDDGTTYVASKMAPVRISTRKDVYAVRNGGGIVGVPDGFVLAYTAHLPLPGSATRSKPHGFLTGVRFDGSSLFEGEASDVNVETHAASLAWSGDVLAAAWNDARVSGNYEVYLGRFTARGQKLAGDQRVSDAPGFSKKPYVVWNRSEFVLVWDDSRKEGRADGNRVAVFGQRAAPDGTLLGESVAIVDDGQVNEDPFVALGSERIGIVYTIAPPTGIGGARLGFRALDAALSLVDVPPAPIGVDVQSPTVHFVGGRFVALWEVYSNATGPADAVWGAAFDQQGRLLLPPRPVTSGARFARFHDALSLGDRLILAWSDDHDGNFEIYSEVLSPELTVLEPRQRLTVNSTDSKSPGLAAGPGGRIGVVFDDEFEGSRQVYFTTLECGARTQ